MIRKKCLRSRQATDGGRITVQRLKFEASVKLRFDCYVTIVFNNITELRPSLVTKNIVIRRKSIQLALVHYEIIMTCKTLTTACSGEC
jgi:hypothetical protein